MNNEEYDELRSYKIVQNIILEFNDQLSMLKKKLDKCENQYQSLGNEIKELKANKNSDYEIFSPRQDNMDNSEMIDLKKSQLSEINRTKNQIEKEIASLKQKVEDLSFVSDTLSKQKKTAEIEYDYDLYEQLSFCKKLCELDVKRAKLELQKIIDNVPRETL